MEMVRGRWKPAIARVLSITAGMLGVGSRTAIVLVGGGMTGLSSPPGPSTFRVPKWRRRCPASQCSPLLLGELGAVLIPLGVLGGVGGVQSLRRRHWPRALAGGICASTIIPALGIPAVVLIALDRAECAPGRRSHDGTRKGSLPPH